MVHSGARPPPRRPPAHGKHSLSFLVPILSGVEPPTLRGTTSRFAVHIWDLGKRGIAQRGHKARHIWDLRWHGENCAIADPTHDEVLHRCGLCAHSSCGLVHIICGCLNTAHARAGARLEALRHSPDPGSSLSFDAEICPTPIWALALQLRGLSLRDGQATLTRIGRGAREVYSDLWDA